MTLGNPALALLMLLPLGLPSWTDFRGPTRDGRIPGAELPLTWSEKENVRWKAPIRGIGWSSPVAWNNTLWMTTATEEGRNLWVVAVDAETGRVVHERILFEVAEPKPKNDLNSFASPSPAIEEGRVYLHFGADGTACLDTETGTTLWERRDILCDHEQGAGSSPILFEDLLIFNMDGVDVQFVIALEKATGKTRWKTPRSVDLSQHPGTTRKGYSTPILVEVDGKLQLISSGAQATAAYDPHSGEEIWTIRHPGFSMSSRPIHVDGLLYLNTGFKRAKLLAVRPTGKGDVTETHVVWSHDRNVPTMASPIHAERRIFMVDDNGVLSALDASTGERLWTERLHGAHCASPIYAGGKLYFFDRHGNTVVVEPGDQYRELAHNTLEEGFMASPAVIGNTLILRTRTHLYGIEQKREPRVPPPD